MKTKILLLLSFTAILVTHAAAQSAIKVQKVIGSSNDDFATCMDLTKDGGLIIGGNTDQSSSRDFNYRVFKLNSTREIEWDKTFGGSDDDYLFDIQQTKDGGYILGGRSLSSMSGDKTESNRGPDGTFDYWIIKIDSSGNKQWDKTLGTPSDDFFFCLWSTADNEYIIGGESNWNIGGDKTQNSKGSYDYWIVKLNAEGAIVWDKTIGSAEADELVDMQQTTDGGYILGGTSAGNISGDKTENSRGGQDYWIVKLNAAGDVEWDKTLGGDDGYENLSALQQTKDEGYIIGGLSSSNISGDKTENSRGINYDYWVIKLNKYSIKEWDKTIGGAGPDYLTSVQQTSDSAYLLGGYSSSGATGDKTQTNRGPRGTDDYWLVKLSNTGNVLTDRTIGGSGVDQCIAARETTNGHFLLTGNSASGISGDKIKPSRGGYDIWLVGLTIPPVSDKQISTAEEISSIRIAPSQQFIAYPNPAKNILHIQTQDKATVTLTDQSGKILFTKIINGNGEINVSKLPAGLYYIKNKEAGTVQKIIITR